MIYSDLKHHLRRIVRFVLIPTAIALWLWWDFSQAHDANGGWYKSFFEPGETAVTTSPAATVAIVRSNDGSLADPCSVTDEAISYTTIAQMVRRAVDLAGGLRRIIKSGDTVLIKPNLVQADSSGSGGITDVRVVKALVFLVDELDHGKITILVGDGSPRPFTTFEKATGTTQKAWKQLFEVSGYQRLTTEALAAGINFRLTNLNGNSDTNPWPELDSVAIPGGGTAQPQGGAYFVHKDVTQATVYITVPVMKIHKEPGYTGALKNQIGLAPSTRYGFNKTTGVLQESRIHKLLHLNQAPYNWQDKEIVDLSTIARIQLAVVDAITCLETDKTPVYTADSSNRNITNRVKMNTIVAGYDPVAVDHVCCRIMGLNPDDIEHITLAERVGLGTNNPDSITVLGSTIEQTKRTFKKGQAWSSIYGQGNRTWLLNGPYATSGVTNPMSYEFIPGEVSLAPRAGTGGWSAGTYFINDQIMLNDYYQSKGVNTGNVVSYAFAYVTAPADQHAQLWVGSDEALKVYLNGTPVYNYSGTRTFAGTECYKDTVGIELKKGFNRLLVKALQSVGSYNFSINVCDPETNPLYRGNRVWGLKFITDPGALSGIDVHQALQPMQCVLNECSPNPFNPRTVVSYQLSVASDVDLTVYDVHGRRVAALVGERKGPGEHRVEFDASGLASGMYFCRLIAGNIVNTRKLLLLR
jgi:uncharacterized protein (DUF362 family)